MSEAKDPFVQIAAGESVFREGDVGTEMFIIESGSVDVMRESRGEEPVATLEAGDFFGEMAVLEDQPRFATVIARSNVRLLRIDRAAFGDVLAQNVEIAVRIMRKLTARLRRSEQRANDAEGALEEFRRKLAARAEVKPSVQTPAAPPAAPPASAAAGVVQLVHTGSGMSFPLSGQSEFLVGRPDPVTGINPEINLGPLDVTRSLSRRHAKVVVQDGKIFLREDVGTTNGTFVNGERLRTGEAVPLKPGDKIRFGSVEIEVAA
jgi:CRP-like cAMP-binding protein